MHSKFQGHYLSENQITNLWENATIVFDTNILLMTYKLPRKVSDEFIKTLQSLSSRLWIPYHVGLEFHRNRINAISSETKKIEEANSWSATVIKNINERTKDLDWDNRDLSCKSEEIIRKFSDACNDFTNAIAEIKSSHNKISSTDDIRSTIVSLFDGKIGPAPINQEQLNTIFQEGDDRFSKKIPPGYKDAKKQDDVFRHNNLEYQRKFGDLIIWKQLLEFSKSDQSTGIIFVTADQKEDWWWIENGMTLGPHPELIYEMSRHTDGKPFWMYSFSQFLKYANSHNAGTVSPETIQEVETIETQPIPSKETTAEDIANPETEIIASILDSPDFIKLLFKDLSGNKISEAEMFQVMFDNPEITKAIINHVATKEQTATSSNNLRRNNRRKNNRR